MSNRKYFMNFEQERLLSLKIKKEEAILLQYLMQFFSSGKAKMKYIHNDRYCWISYIKLCNDLPILGKKPRTFMRLVSSLAQKEILQKHVENNNRLYLKIDIDKLSQCEEESLDIKHQNTNDNTNASKDKTSQASKSSIPKTVVGNITPNPVEPPKELTLRDKLKKTIDEFENKQKFMHKYFNTSGRILQKIEVNEDKKLLTIRAGFSSNVYKNYKKFENLTLPPTRTKPPIINKKTDTGGSVKQTQNKRKRFGTPPGHIWHPIVSYNINNNIITIESEYIKNKCELVALLKRYLKITTTAVSYTSWFENIYITKRDKKIVQIYAPHINIIQKSYSEQLQELVTLAGKKQMRRESHQCYHSTYTE